MDQTARLRLALLHGVRRTTAACPRLLESSQALREPTRGRREGTADHTDHRDNYIC